MDQNAFYRALQNTKMYRHRQRGLFTFGETKLPYIFLGDLGIDKKIMVREGEIVVARPLIVSPHGNGNVYEGFGEYDDELSMIQIGWMANLGPYKQKRTQPRKYTHEQHKLYEMPRSLDDAVKMFMERLGKEEDEDTALIRGIEKLWFLSLAIYTTFMMDRSIDGVIKELMEKDVIRKEDFPDLPEGPDIPDVW